MSQQTQKQKTEIDLKNLLNQDGNDLMKQLGIKPTFDLNNRDESDKKKGILGKIRIDEDFVSKLDQPTDLVPIPIDILRHLRDSKGTRSQMLKMGYVLPRKSSCPLNFMLQILSRQKKGMKIHKDEVSIEYKPHLESLHYEDVKANNWLDYLDKFTDWQMYIPSKNVKRIQEQKALPKVFRTHTNFDNKFLISVLRSINENLYDETMQIFKENRLNRITIITNPRPQISKIILDQMRKKMPIINRFDYNFSINLYQL